MRTSRKPNHFYAKKSTDKPWFGRQCKTAHTKYFLAKHANRQLRTKSSKQSLIKMSKEYTKMLNIHINKYKRSRRKVLRKMQSKEPKKYWTFLNSLKTKKMANTPSVDTFYDFFKDVYCADDDKTEDEMPFNFKFVHSDESK